MATKRLPVDKFVPIFSSFEVTGGLGVGGIAGPFVGVDTRLPLKLFLQAEYDSHDVNAAAGWQPAKMFRIKGYTIDGHFFAGAELLPITF